MDFSLFKKIVDEIARYKGTGIIPFFRGESLLHPDFISMISYANSKGIKPIQLATNASLLDDSKSDAIFRLGIDFISFSLDGVNEDIYKKVRPGCDYSRVIANINNFLNKRKRRNRMFPQVQVSLVETAVTKETIPKFVHYWLKRVDRVRIYKEHSNRGKFGNIRSSGNIFKKRLACLKPMTETAIYWNGEVAICNHDWMRKDPMGNISKESLRSIWKNKKYAALRKLHFAGNADLDDTCKDCSHWMSYYLPEGLIGRLYKRADYVRNSRDS